MATMAAFIRSALAGGLRHVLGTVLGKLAGLLYFCDSHFTYLAISLFCATGSALIFLTCYLGRYGKYDWWNWKGRALGKSIRLCLLLLLLKKILEVAI